MDEKSDSSRALRVGVFGAGGVGGYLAARLASCGADVTVVARGEHLQAIKDHGLKLTSISGSCTVLVKATDDPSQVGEMDLAIVACKSWQVETIAPSLKSWLGPETLVVPTQNGVEAPERLAAQLGKERVLGGYIRIQALVQEPGHIVHDGLMQAEFGVGALPGAGSFVPKRLQVVKAAFRDAVGLELVLCDDVWSKMWRKLSAICAYSGVCTASRSDIGEVVACPESKGLLVQLLTETLQVAISNGVGLPHEEVDGIVKEYEGLAANSPSNTPSLMRDMLAGRPSELDDQLGAVLRYAARSGTSTPGVAALHAVLLPQERRNRAILAQK